MARIISGYNYVFEDLLALDDPIESDVVYIYAVVKHLTDPISYPQKAGSMTRSECRLVISCGKLKCSKEEGIWNSVAVFHTHRAYRLF